MISSSLLGQLSHNLYDHNKYGDVVNAERCDRAFIDDFEVALRHDYPTISRMQARQIAILAYAYGQDPSGALKLSAHLLGLIKMFVVLKERRDMSEYDDTDRQVDCGNCCS